MKILVENAGAGRGFLLVEQNGSLSIEASWDSSTNQASLFESVLSEDSEMLSPSIVNYVSRTKQDVIFENATDEGKFKDAYILKYKPKSVLCIPLLKLGKLVGIVYLENNITTGAFTKDRIEVLKMLSSQAAISIENATLYDNLELLNENLEKKVQERTSEIQEKNEQLVDLNGTKDKFFSIIAHDLRGPFTGFLGLTELIVGGIENLSKSEILEYTKLMNTSANNLFKLLENLLEWAKMQKGVTKFNPEKSLLFPIVKNNIDLIAEFASQKNIELINAVPMISMVSADTQMLNAIVRNFISNALKFTPKGGKVEIGAINGFDDGKSVCIYVKDNGIGMSQESIDKLFKIDQKVSRLGTNGELSSGLGLFLCKEFIEKHGGRIWVESEVEKGSTFKFTLPKTAIVVSELN
jgi:signal transduction histidine kinase